MARLFLHVGAHKTATSYLQGLFHHNRQALAEAGLYYPAIGPNNAHHALAASWLDMPDLPPRFFASQSPDELWESRILRPYADRSGTVFLSAENFSRVYPKQVDMAALAKRLSVFEEVRIVYTLREQAALLNSLWVQVARDRRPPTLRTYVDRVFTTGMAGGVTLDHHGFYRRLLTGFAPEQILLLDYEDIRSRPGGVAQAFLDLMAVPVDAASLAQPPESEHNISPDPLAMWLASQICRDRSPPADLVAITRAILLSGGERPTSLLGQREHARIRSQFGPGNARLSLQVAAVQPGFSYAPPPPAPDMLYRDQIPPHVWPDIAAALWRETTTGALRHRRLDGFLKQAVSRMRAWHGALQRRR